MLKTKMSAEKNKPLAPAFKERPANAVRGCSSLTRKHRSVHSADGHLTFPRQQRFMLQRCDLFEPLLFPLSPAGCGIPLPYLLKRSSSALQSKALYAIRFKSIV